MNKTIRQQSKNQLKQKYLGKKGFIIFIAFLGAFVPLSTDAYLPALPQMVKHLNTTAGSVNLTLVLFFIFYAVGILFWFSSSMGFQHFIFSIIIQLTLHYQNTFYDFY